MNYDNMRNMLDDVKTLLEFGDPQAQQGGGDEAVLKHTMMTMQSLQDAAIQAFPGNRPKPIDQAKLAKYIQMAKAGATTPLRFNLAGASDMDPNKVSVTCNIINNPDAGIALNVFVNGKSAGKFMSGDFAKYGVEDFVGFLKRASGGNVNPSLPGKGQISFGAGID